MLAKHLAISCIAMVPLSLCGDAKALDFLPEPSRIIIRPPPATDSSAVGAAPTAFDLAAQSDAIARIPNARVRCTTHGVPDELEGVLGIYKGEDPERELQEFMAGIRLAMLGTGTESLRQVRIAKDELRAQNIVHVEQFIRGRPVSFAGLVLHIEAATGTVVHVNGHFLPDRMPAEPKLQGSEAVSRAIEVFERGYPGAHDIYSVAEPILAYGFDAERRGHLVWKLELSFAHAELGRVNDLVMIDAWNGALVRHWPLSQN